ncbi:coiled-coil and c2 domain-containing protein 1b [Limosa lapponica baueri]|uniref:Coiled-coil and c2 domain-containing protein 1b n=1 Tax=Limosa lapponica baueri TaxID=1758121 RepID=A0A2I0TCJ1_LIMLA|nr:coiled-coil and c2 domain-containing protein 1b [Limosa lapponica baueri]
MLLGAEEGEDDGDLEAELAALTGAKVKEGKSKPKGKTPLPMDHIEKMAAECMKDLNEDEEEEADDEDLEKDTDLLTTSLPAVTSELQQTIEKRIADYRTAVSNAKESGEGPKIRRYERGLKKFNVVLEALDSGQPIDLQNMPPSPQDLESRGGVRDASKQKVPAPGGSSQDLTTLEPSTQEASASLQQPKTVLEALQQRLEKYKSAAAQAKASGDDRKGRMHERIAKVKRKCSKPFELVFLPKTFSKLK